MTDPHMPRVDAGEAEPKIKIGDRVMVALNVVVVSDSGLCWKGALSDGESGIWFDKDDLVLPAPAPQDTAEAMAEVERLLFEMRSASAEAEVAARNDRINSDTFADLVDKLHAADRAVKDAVRALADRATTAEAARDEVAAYAQRLQIALTGAAGGGSENFVQHGDGFRADIPFCVTKINQRFHDTMDSLKAEIRARKAAEAALASLRAEREVPDLRPGLQKALEVIGPAGARPCDCERCDCGKPGDAAEVAVWDEANSQAAALRTLISAQKDRADG